MNQTNEHAFESAIEYYLTHFGGYTQGDRDSFDSERGLFPQDVLSFVKETQPKEWEYLVTLQKDRTETILLDDLCRALNSEHEGCLSVLRHGFKCFGKLFRMAFFAPRKQTQSRYPKALCGKPSHHHATASVFEQARENT